MSKNIKRDNTQDDDDNDKRSVAHSTTSTTKVIEWSPENEMIMVEWCDIAQCYKWLNSKAHSKYSSMHAWMTIPAITLSTISGTASFAQASLPKNYQEFAPMVIGTLNILIGILTTIQQYLKISELNEAHRVAAISWDKFARNIRIELAKSPDERMDAGSFLKISRQEFDRLMETCPSIPPQIIKMFNETFQGKPDSPERKRYDELKKPDICDIIVTANANRHHWYLDVENNMNGNNNNDNDNKMNTFMSANLSLLEKESQIKEREEAIRRKDRAELEMQNKQLEKQLSLQKMETEHVIKEHEQHEKIKSYINTFYDIYGRNPISDEIRVHSVETLHIDDDILDEFLKKYEQKDHSVVDANPSTALRILCM